MTNYLKFVLILILVSIFQIALAYQPPYPKFDMYMQAAFHEQIYCKTDFTPEGQALIKHYFKYAVSICGDQWDQLTVDPQMQEGYQYYLKKAEAGDGEAAYIVASARLQNFGVDDSKDVSNLEAISWFKKSADLGYPTGMAASASLYKNNTMYAITHTKEVSAVKYKLYLKAAEKNSPAAYAYLIMVYDYRKNYNQVRFLLERAKKANYFNTPELVAAEAIARVQGKGFPKNPALGLELLKKVLTYKNALMETIQTTLSQIGGCYYTGLGTKKDLKQAFSYYRQAALLNYGYAQNKLGDMYYSGLGVQQDKAKANYWYCAAYKHGYMPTRECSNGANAK